jgi:putative ABC transport system substrate-binding protein
VNRRKTIALLGGAAVAWPLAAKAQQPTMPVIGFLHSASPEQYSSVVAAFRNGLLDEGFIDGRNVTIEFRWAQGRYDRLPALAAELVQRGVVVIAAGSTDAALAAKRATTTIPIVFNSGADPVKLGLVASLNRPGGNTTGVTFLTNELVPKRVEALHELLPKAAMIGFLVNPSISTSEVDTKVMQETASAFGMKLVIENCATEPDFDPAFARLIQQRVEALVVEPDPFFNSKAAKLVALAAHNALPTIYQLRDYVAAGGLMSYGTSLTDAYRLVGVYTGRILKGANPAELPVQQSVKVELVINLKTAKALGLTVPTGLLVRADEVIE